MQLLPLRVPIFAMTMLYVVALQAQTGTPGAFIYGIDVANDVWEINPADQTTSKVVLHAKLTQTANCLAYDSSRNQLLFVNAANTFKYWERATDTVKDVQGLSLGLTSDPNQCAYYNDSLYYFEHNSNILKQANLTYVGSGETAVPFTTSVNSYAVLGMSAFGVNTNSFGDIAIHSGTGILYAVTSRGRIYSIDLASPITSFNEVVASSGNSRSAGYQLSFDLASATLYAHSYATGNWFTMNTSDGSLSQIAGFTTLVSGGRGFRDLGGSAQGAFTPPP